MTNLNDTPPASPEPVSDKKTITERFTGTTAKVTAAMVAISAVLTQIPQVTNALKSAYCSVFGCYDAQPIVSPSQPMVSPSQPVVSPSQPVVSPSGEFASVSNESLRHLAYQLSQEIESFRSPYIDREISIKNDKRNRSHSPVHRSNDAESVAVRIAKQGLRVGANRILRLVCLTDSTPT